MPQKRIMISYSHQDTEVVEAIEESLKRAGIAVWRDDQIPLGYDWLKIILSEIDRSDHLLLILSRASIQSKYVQIEELFGRAKDKIEGKQGFIIPVLIEPCHDLLSRELARIQNIDLTDSVHRTENMNRLLDAILVSRRKTVEDSNPLSQNNMIAILATVCVVEICSYSSVLMTEVGNRAITIYFLCLCLPLLFGVFIILGFVRGVQSRNRSVVIISAIACLLALAPFIILRVFYRFPFP